VATGETQKNMKGLIIQVWQWCIYLL